MSEDLDLIKISDFINKTADDIEAKLLSDIRKSLPESSEIIEKPSFTFTSGSLDAYMG